MDDDSIRAREAHSWAYAVLKSGDGFEAFQSARKEMGDMIMHLASGAAVSFRKRSDFIEQL